MPIPQFSRYLPTEAPLETGVKSTLQAYQDVSRTLPSPQSLAMLPYQVDVEKAKQQAEQARSAYYTSKADKTETAQPLSDLGKRYDDYSKLVEKGDKQGADLILQGIQADIARTRAQATKEEKPAPTPGEDALAKAKANQFVKDFSKVNDDANKAVTKTLPILNDLKSSLDKIPIAPGPVSGKLLWTSPEGQYYQAKLKQLQKLGYEGVKGIRNWPEFQLMMNAMGSDKYSKQASLRLYNDAIGEQNQLVEKAKHYKQYSDQGGYDPEIVGSTWIQKTQAQQGQKTQQNSAKWNSVLSAAKSNPQGFAAEAKKYGMSSQQYLDYIKNQLGVQ